MKITERKEGNNNILQIDEARIVYRNFSGAIGKYNPSGERSFAVVIPDYIDEKDSLQVTDLIDRGWHIKTKPPIEEGEEPFHTLPIKIKYLPNRCPAIYVCDGENTRLLTEDMIGMIDELNIVSVDLDVRPYHWEMGNNTGTTAYVQSMCVTFAPDRFANRVNI